MWHARSQGDLELDRSAETERKDELMVVWLTLISTAGALLGAVVGGYATYMATKRQLLAAVETDRRGRKLDAYVDFLKCARSYRNAIRPSVITKADIRDVDVLAQAAFTAGSFVFLVAESPETLHACRRILSAIGDSRDRLHDLNHSSHEAHWPGANEAMELSLRQFQVAVREELGVRGVEKSWILARGKPTKEAAGM